LPGNGIPEKQARLRALHKRRPLPWKLEERVLKKSTGALIRKGRYVAGPSIRSGKEGQTDNQIVS
jgi:hypothetical protein